MNTMERTKQPFQVMPRGEPISCYHHKHNVDTSVKPLLGLSLHTWYTVAQIFLFSLASSKPISSKAAKNLPGKKSKSTKQPEEILGPLNDVIVLPGFAAILFVRQFSFSNNYFLTK